MKCKNILTNCFLLCATVAWLSCVACVAWAQDVQEPAKSLRLTGAQIVAAQKLGRVRTFEDPLLSKVEIEDRVFTRLENPLFDVVSFFHQRTIGQAIVEKDFIRYMFKASTGELIEEERHWRKDLPERLPPIIDQARAEAMVLGEIQGVRLMFISPESNVFKLDPVPVNPCWIVTAKGGENENALTIYIIDAVTGKFLGYGTPPPYEGLSIDGPDWDDPPDHVCDNTKPQWNDWAENARVWFEAMGYSTQKIGSATESQIRSHIQSDSTVMFYELDHGGATRFHNRCEDDTYAKEIESWISNYSSVPFAFIGSCGAMTSFGDDTFEFEFRKGLSDDTVVVGYNGMSDWVCEHDCWNYSVDWQNKLFYYMNNGYSVSQAYAHANALYPDCTDDGRTCMLISGDTGLRFAGSGVPKMTRSFNGAVYNMPPSYSSPFPSVLFRTDTRAYHIRTSAYVPSGYYLTMAPTSTNYYLDLVFVNSAIFSVYGSFWSMDASNGEITLVSEQDRSRGMKLKFGQGGKVMVYTNGQIKIY